MRNIIERAVSIWRSVGKSIDRVAPLLMALTLILLAVMFAHSVSIVVSAMAVTVALFGIAIQLEHEYTLGVLSDWEP